jgi:hypothetical protein
MTLPLASLDDFVVRLGRPIADGEEQRIRRLLDDASADVRSFTGQTITPAITTQRSRLAWGNGTIRLWQRPVTGVQAVAWADGTVVDEAAWRWDGLDLVELAAGTPFDAGYAPWAGVVDVTYSHGYAVVPADLVAVTAQKALRAFGVKPEDSGMTSESISGYSYSTGGAAASGGVGKLADEREVLLRYKRVGSTTRLTRAS